MRQAAGILIEKLQANSAKSLANVSCHERGKKYLPWQNASNAEPRWPIRREGGTVKLAESRLGKSRVGQVKGRDEDASRPDLRRPSLPR